VAGSETQVREALDDIGRCIVTRPGVEAVGVDLPSPERVT